MVDSLYFYRCTMESQQKLRIVLVDDHQMFLDGLTMILSQEADLELLDTYQSAVEVLGALDRLAPDLLVTDLNMPEMDGTELTLRVKERFPEVKILVLSMHNDRKTVTDIIAAEAEGYVLKNSNKSELLKAIRTVGHGGTYYSHDIVSIILSSYQKKERQMEAVQVLTDREKEVLELIAQELTNDEIADKLFISKRTVETHRKNMMSKTNANSIVGLLKFAVRNELILFQ